MSSGKYSDSRFNTIQQMPIWGNSGTALLVTPQAGTGAETKTHTTTLLAQGFGRAVKLKKLVYTVTTALTGAGCSLALDVYKNTTSVGSLAVTTQTAGQVVASSSDLDVAFASTDYIRVLAKSTTTASDANSAVGFLSATYEEAFV